MGIETLISAILPSLCVSVTMMFFNRRQTKKDRAEAKQLEQGRKSERLQLSLLLASAKLSYAVASAVKNGRVNGEMEEGMKQYEAAMNEFKQFERDLVAEKNS